MIIQWQTMKRINQYQQWLLICLINHQIWFLVLPPRKGVAKGNQWMTFKIFRLPSTWNTCKWVSTFTEISLQEVNISISGTVRTPWWDSIYKFNVESDKLMIIKSANTLMEIVSNCFCFDFSGVEKVLG